MVLSQVCLTFFNGKNFRPIWYEDSMNILVFQMEISNIPDIQYERARLDFNNTSSHSLLSNVTRTQHFNRGERREQEPIGKYFAFIKFKVERKIILNWYEETSLYIFGLFLYICKDDPLEGSWGFCVYFPLLVVQDFNQTL